MTSLSSVCASLVRRALASERSAKAVGHTEPAVLATELQAEGKGSHSSRNCGEWSLEEPDDMYCVS
jgi:hypothetical protein